MYSTCWFKMLLKLSMLKDLQDWYAFIWGVPLKLPDFEIVDISFWWSDRWVSKVFENLYILLWFVNIR